MSARARIRSAHTAIRTADAGAATCYVWIFGRSSSARRVDDALGGYRVDENWEAKPIARAGALP